MQLGNARLVPALTRLPACDSKYAALPLVLLVGLATNIQGLVADRHGPRGAFVVLAAIPLLAVALSTVQLSR